MLQHFLQNHAAQRGRPLRIFLDKTDLATRGLWSELGEALASSRRLLLAVTPSSVASANVQRELALFREARPDGEVVVLLLAGQPALVPGEFAGHKYAEIRKAVVQCPPVSVRRRGRRCGSAVRGAD